MKTEIWYWEYQLKIWNEDESKEEICSGIVVANTFTEAMKQLEWYYDKEIMEVQMLKAIMEGVFEFQSAMEDSNFDYIINKKM